ncbi:Translation initiation factor [Trichinella pseudospiralis]
MNFGTRQIHAPHWKTAATVDVVVVGFRPSPAVRKQQTVYAVEKRKWHVLFDLRCPLAKAGRSIVKHIVVSRLGRLNGICTLVPCLSCSLFAFCSFGRSLITPTAAFLLYPLPPLSLLTPLKLCDLPTETTPTKKLNAFFNRSLLIYIPVFKKLLFNKSSRQQSS